jgi:cytochrome oxidase Cu insertion factor (SCO1/SenC/PrrC family)
MRNRKIFLLAFACLLFYQQGVAQVQKSIRTDRRGTYIGVFLKGFTKIPDSLYLSTSQNDLYDSRDAYQRGRKLFASNHTDSLYTFRLPDEQLVSYFSLFKKYDTGKNVGLNDFFLINYLYEAGDSVLIIVKPDAPYDLAFSGKNSNKFSCINEIKSLDDRNYGNNGSIVAENGQYNTHNNIDVKTKDAIRVLRKYKSSITIPVFNILRLNILGEQLRYKLWNIRIVAKKQKQKAGKFYKRYLEHDTLKNIDEKIKMYSTPYLHYLLEKVFIQNILAEDLRPSNRQLYNSIKSIHNSAVRDYMLTFFISTYEAGLENKDSIVSDALSIITEPRYVEVLVRMSNFSPGKKAYNFVLPDQSGKIISLHQFLGKIVFIDFWFTGCSACTKFYKSSVKLVEEKYKRDTQIVFITVAFDSIKEKWLKSIQTGLYTSPDIINLYTEGKGVDHPLLKFYGITSAPRPLLIRPDGVIAAVDQAIYSETNLIAEIEKLRLN